MQSFILVLLLIGSIPAWSVRTAGALNRDAELKLHMRNHWNLAKVNMDFFTGKEDIAQINESLFALIIELRTDAQVDNGCQEICYEAWRSQSHHHQQFWCLA